MWRSMDKLNDDVGTEAGINLAFTRGQFNVCQAVLAMPELGCDQFLEKRMQCARSNWNVTPVREGHHSQRVLQTHCRRDVSWHDGDCTDIQLRRVEGEHERQRVVSAGVSVEDDFFRRRGWHRKAG